MNFYVDSSFLLDQFLAPKPASRITTFDRLYASELVRVELSRVAHRMRATREIGPAAHMRLLADVNGMEGTVSFMSIDSTVMSLAAAERLGVVKSLDAIHLATALLWQAHLGAPVTMLTLDRSLAASSSRVGLDVGP